MALSAPIIATAQVRGKVWSFRHAQPRQQRHLLDRGRAGIGWFIGIAEKSQGRRTIARRAAGPCLDHGPGTQRLASLPDADSAAKTGFVLNSGFAIHQNGLEWAGVLASAASDAQQLVNVGHITR